MNKKKLLLFLFVVLLSNCKPRTNRADIKPISGIVYSVYEEPFKRGGVNYKRIILVGGEDIHTNGYNVIRNSKKVNIISILNRGDSVVKDNMCLYVYRNGILSDSSLFDGSWIY